MINDGLSIESSNNNGDRLLIHALLHHSTHCANLLVSLGADVNVPGINGQTPLTRLCGETKSFLHEIKFLLNIGAQVNALNGMCKTALCLAVQCNNTCHVKILLENKADITAVVNRTVNLLTRSLLKQRFEMAKLLIDCGAIVNVPNWFNLTPLHAAITECPDKEHRDIYFPMLLDAGANINTWTDDGNSPFLQAVMNHDSELVELLLMKGHELGHGRIISDEVERFLICALDMRCCTSAVININVMFFGCGENCDTSKICNKHPIIYHMQQKNPQLCLKMLCRHIIRNTLMRCSAKNLYYLVLRLTLPTYLRNYILFKV